MPEEPTPWELHRNYEQLRTDVREGFAQINGRLDQMPTTAVLNSLSKDVGRLETLREKDEERRVGDRRLVWGAFLAAALSLVGSVALRAIGA